jgi:RNA polymerase sigma factor (sigma-70 family)
VTAWLRRVSLNLASNQIRSRRRAEDRLRKLGDLESTLYRSAPSAAQEAIKREDQAEVRLALESLPERSRNCLVLRYSGYSYQEIADTLEVALGSVGVYLARAERAFREVYQEKSHELP